MAQGGQARVTGGNREERLMSIISADPRSDGDSEELVAWVAADPAVIRAVKADVEELFTNMVCLTICCLPFVLIAFVYSPCSITDNVMERNFRRKTLGEAASHVYVITSSNGRRGYATVDINSQSVVWMHTDRPRLEMVAGDWSEDEIEDDKQKFFIMRPKDWEKGKKASTGCDSESRAAFAKSYLLQTWFLDLTKSFSGAPSAVNFLEEFRQELRPDAMLYAHSAITMPSRPSAPEPPSAASKPSPPSTGGPKPATAVTNGVRLRVCLDGGKVSLVTMDVSSFDAFLGQLATHFGLERGTNFSVYVDIEGDRVALEQGGLHTLAKDEKVVVVV